MIRHVGSNALLCSVVAARYPYAEDKLSCRTARHPHSKCRGLLCTRPAGHDGPHVAHGGKDYPILMWDDNEEAYDD